MLLLSLVIEDLQEQKSTVACTICLDMGHDSHGRSRPSVPEEVVGAVGHVVEPMRLAGGGAPPVSAKGGTKLGK